MQYIIKIFRTSSFRHAPVATISRAATWLAHVMTSRRALVRIPVGSTSFVLDLPPLLRASGSTGIYVQRERYEPLLQFCDRLVKPGDVVFDCGANQGIYACAFAALVGPSGKVVAFEPQDYAVAALRNNIKTNQFTNVVVEHAAVSDREGSAVLDVSHGAVSASIVRDFGRQAAMSVPTVTLAGAAERCNIQRLDVLKMDVEGAEYLALSGAESLLDRFKPTIILEATPQESAWQQIVALLSRHGYTPHVFNAKGELEGAADLAMEHPNVVFR